MPILKGDHLVILRGERILLFDESEAEREFAVVDGPWYTEAEVGGEWRKSLHVQLAVVK